VTEEEEVNDDKNITFYKVNIKDSSKKLQEEREGKNINLIYTDRLSVLNEIEANNVEDNNYNNIVEYKSKKPETNNIALDKESNYSVNITKPKIKQDSYELYLDNLEKVKESSKNSKININFFQIANLFCCKESLKSKEKKILNAYELGSKYIDERTDIIYLFDIYSQIEIAKSTFLKEDIAFLINSLKKQNICTKKGYEYIKKHVKNFDDEVDTEEQSNIKDTNKIIYDKLISIKEYLSKVKQYEVDNMNLEGHLTHENIIKLIKEINPIYQDVIMNNKTQ